MSREYRLFLHDIADCCDKVLRYTSGYDLPRFVADTLVYDAVARNLEISGGRMSNGSHTCNDRTLSDAAEDLILHMADEAPESIP